MTLIHLVDLMCPPLSLTPESPFPEGRGRCPENSAVPPVVLPDLGRPGSVRGRWEPPVGTDCVWFIFRDPFVLSSTRPRLPQSHESVSSCKVSGAENTVLKRPAGTPGERQQSSGTRARRSDILAWPQSRAAGAGDLAGDSRPEGRALG